MYAIVDLETTGGNPARDRVIEVAIVIHNGKRVIESFNSLVNPGRSIPPFIQAFTGITNDMVIQAPYFEDLAGKIREITQDRVFVAHNVRFDYGFLRNELKRNGLTFNRQQLCTVRLSKDLLPGRSTYRLKRICDDLAIPLENNHRAVGDAMATAQLFDHLLEKGKPSQIQQFISYELARVQFPPHLKKEKVDLLPEEMGVYYLLNKNNQVLYVGKSKNIRQRVLDHFSSDLKSEKALNMKEAISHVQTRLTGNDLVASLLETQEIKRFMPAFNRAQRRKHYRYGIFHRHDPESGYDKLETSLINLTETPLKSFTRRKTAADYLKRYVIKQGLCFWLTNLAEDPFGCKDGPGGTCIGTCPLKNDNQENYNQHLRGLVANFRYPYSHFFIRGRGRTRSEYSLVHIEDDIYQGFGFVNRDEFREEPEWLKQQINPGWETSDVPEMIINYLKKNKKDRLIYY